MEWDGVAEQAFDIDGCRQRFIVDYNLLSQIFRDIAIPRGHRDQCLAGKRTRSDAIACQSAPLNSGYHGSQRIGLASLQASWPVRTPTSPACPSGPASSMSRTIA